jgi:hypothetical protein
MNKSIETIESLPPAKTRDDILNKSLQIYTTIHSMREMDPQPSAPLGEWLSLYCGKSSIKWRTRLAKYIASINGCRCLIRQQGHIKRLALFGTESVTSLVSLMFESIQIDIQQIVSDSVDGKYLSNNMRLSIVNEIIAHLEVNRLNESKDLLDQSLILDEYLRSEFCMVKEK